MLYSGANSDHDGGSDDDYNSDGGNDDDNDDNDGNADDSDDIACE